MLTKEKNFKSKYILPGVQMCSCIKTCMIRTPNNPLKFIVENTVCSWFNKNVNGDVSAKPQSFYS